MSPPTATVLALILIASAASAAARNSICSGSYLYAGDYLEWSPYMFIMQSDCDLVLYKGTVPMWSTGTSGMGGGAACFAGMYKNYLVVYAGQQILWSKGFTPGYNKYCVVLKSDGGVYVYGYGYGQTQTALWSTNTTQG